MTLTCGSWSEHQHDLYFTVQWFYHMFWRLFDIWTSYFGIMSRYEPAFDLKINVGHCNLYCMVKGFCLIISWRLFDVWTSYLRITSQYDWTFDLKINVGHCDLYFMFQWFCLISWRLCMNIILCDYQLVWHDIWMIWLKNKCRSQRPIFHGPVILCICCMNIIVWDYEWVWHDIWLENKFRSLWPIFHGPVILSYILKTSIYEQHTLGLWVSLTWYLT